MRATGAQCAEYLARVAELLERLGLTLILPPGDDDLVLLEAADGALSFELLAELPAEGAGVPAQFAIREELRRVGRDRYERTRYEHELVDPMRDFRRAFHLHDPEWFRQRFLVVVHEHCERPLGRPACRHHEGSPVKDACAGVGALLEAWIGEPPDCQTLRCLE